MPVSEHMVYLDNNATTPVDPAVAERMAAFLREQFGNPSSLYPIGRKAKEALTESREAVAGFLGAHRSEVTFTSSGTEADNFAILGVLEAHPDKTEIVTSAIEHPAVIETARALEKKGITVRYAPVDGTGLVDLDFLRSAVTPRTALVSVMHANNELGTIQPIAAIAALCRMRGVLLHVDAVQALGKLPVELGGVDLCALSAHKLGGPVGIGGLVVRRGVALRPLTWGGEQERGLRPGTENALGAVGFAAAVAAGQGDAAAVGARRDRLWLALRDLPGLRRYSPAQDCLPNTLAVGLDGLRGEALVAGLDLEGVAVSVGSACAAGSGEPSHVLRAIGCDEAAAAAGVRFSLGAETTAADIDAAAAVVWRVVAHMRSIGTRAAVG